MKIVLLDAYTLNPGDLSWQGLEELGEVAIYDRTPSKSLVIERARDAQVIVSNKCVIDREIMMALPALELIVVSATGYNIVDLEAATSLGKAVCNSPAYAKDSVAQHVFALLLAMTNRVYEHADASKRGQWSASPDWTFMLHPMPGLVDMTIGIIGLGNIGMKVAEIAKAFGMSVLAHSRSPKEIDGVTFCDLESLFKQSDVITLHTPLNEQSQHIINERSLSWMKGNALLINTSRGGLIDEEALLNALSSGSIGGAALDVLSEEPPPEDHILLNAPHCLITPHQAWATHQARALLLSIVEENIRQYQQGRFPNKVN